MKKKFGLLILFLCLIFLGCDEHSKPCPENFNIVELRSDGVTFEADHVVIGDSDKYAAQS